MVVTAVFAAEAVASDGARGDSARGRACAGWRTNGAGVQCDWAADGGAAGVAGDGCSDRTADEEADGAGRDAACDRARHDRQVGDRVTELDRATGRRCGRARLDPCHGEALVRAVGAAVFLERRRVVSVSRPFGAEAVASRGEPGPRVDV